MMAQTQEQKDIVAINENIASIRGHLKTIKERQDVEDSNRIEQNRKLDLIVNSLTDHDYNGKNGLITKLNNIERTVILHELYWKILFTFVIAGGLLVGAIKYLIK